MASMASGDRKDPQVGTNIMIAGVIFQLAAMTAFAGLALDFVRRSYPMGITRQYQLALVGLFISLGAIYARSIFRAVELCEGWTGYLMQNERFFIGLDGSLMVIAVGVFLVLDPSRLVPKDATKLSRSSSMELKAPEAF